MQKTILKTIRDVLESDGTEVYFPSQHKGECNKKYIVIKNGGVSPLLTVSSERPIYSVLFYVPQNNYSELESFINETKQKLRKLYPMIEYAGNETPSFYDDEIRAHMISIDYYGIRKILKR